MRKIAYILAFLLSVNLLIINVYAFVDTTKEEKSQGEKLKVTTFNDYEPIGKLVGTLDIYGMKSIFTSELDKFAQNKNYVLEPVGLESSLITNVRAVRSGKIDVIVGAYSLTKLYNGIELIYPAMITNPISVAMMPEKIDRIKMVEDLKGLRGIRIKDEVFNDYVEKILTKFKVETAKDAYEAYEKLFIGDVDYIIGGYYYLLKESIIIGVRNYVSFSRKPLWEIPVFIGVSKTTRANKKMLIKFLSAWSNTPSVKENIKQNLKDYIENLEREYDGVVPPLYIKQDDTPTPAGNVAKTQDDNAQDGIKSETTDDIKTPESQDSAEEKDNTEEKEPKVLSGQPKPNETPETYSLSEQKEGEK
mgnify:CR=1 FL=1